jgi:hypothetical protein
MAAAAGAAALAPPTAADERHMRRAIQLSRKAGFEERSGKCFGAVIVDVNGKVVAENWNQVGCFSTIVRRALTWVDLVMCLAEPP